MPLRRSIKVDDEVYERLQQLARELGVDSPNQVLRKLLFDGVGPRPVPSISNSFAERFFQCLESTRIDFVSAVSCAAWAKAVEELGDRPLLIAIDVKDFGYEVAIVKDLGEPVAYVYNHGRYGLQNPVRHTLSICALLGLLIAVREDIETGTHFERLGYRCSRSRYGEYLAYTCFREDDLGHRHVLLLIRRDVFECIPRAESYIEIDGHRVRRVLTSFCYTFLGPLPMQEVPQVLYVAQGQGIDARIGVSLCNAWNGSSSGDMWIAIELENRSQLDAAYSVLTKIFGRKNVKKHRKSIGVESHVHTLAAQLGIELGEIRKLEDLNTVINNIDKLVATILKQVFSCIRVAPSKRRA